MENLILMGENAKKAAYDLSILSTKTKNNALALMAKELLDSKEEIIRGIRISIFCFNLAKKPTFLLSSSIPLACMEILIFSKSLAISGIYRKASDTTVHTL